MSQAKAHRQAIVAIALAVMLLTVAVVGGTAVTGYVPLLGIVGIGLAFGAIVTVQAARMLEER